MDERIKRLLGFLTVDEPIVLLTPCNLKKEAWLKDIKAKEIRCTSSNCEKEEGCIKMHPEGLFLPFDKFDVWILNLEEFPYSPGYAFYSGYQALKDFGIIAIIRGVDEYLDSVALSYGFQILYHGRWHYYLKAGKGKSLEIF